jgi:hypothetical protein
VSQLSLFPDLAPASATPLVPAPWPCTCGDCGKHLKWASHALASEIRSGFVTGLSSFDPGCRP